MKEIAVRWESCGVGGGGKQIWKREIKESLQRDSVLLGYRLQEEFSLEQEELRAELRAELRTEPRGPLKGDRGAKEGIAGLGFGVGCKMFERCLVCFRVKFLYINWPYGHGLLLRNEMKFKTLKKSSGTPGSNLSIEEGCSNLWGSEKCGNVHTHPTLPVSD